MREKLVIGLLSACCVLLMVNAVALLQDDVHGQSAASGTGSGDFLLATGSTSNNQMFAIIYNTSKTRLAAYTVGNRGMELKGVRDIQYDLELIDLVPRGRLSVQQIKNQVQSAKKKRP